MVEPHTFAKKRVSVKSSVGRMRSITTSHARVLQPDRVQHAHRRLVDAVRRVAEPRLARRALEHDGARVACSRTPRRGCIPRRSRRSRTAGRSARRVSGRRNRRPGRRAAAAGMGGIVKERARTLSRLDEPLELLDRLPAAPRSLRARGRRSRSRRPSRPAVHHREVADALLRHQFHAAGATSSPGVTVTTGELMICQTGVSADDRPSRTTLRA